MKIAIEKQDKARMLIVMCALILCFHSSMLLSAHAQENLHTQLQDAIDDGSLAGLHSVLLLHEGETFIESYFEGEDERWGVPLGVKAHGPNTRHDLRSITKSIVGLLYAIARDDNIVPSPDASLMAQFPEYIDLQSDDQKKAITIEHVLTMTMGTAWDENLPYTDPRNSEIAMERSSDRYRYILEQPVVSAPGEKWNYSGGATALIAKLISDNANMPIDYYADARLFKPLGISEYTWIKGRDGEPSAASGLRMRASDLAKIGQLIANKGFYEGKQIVSEKSLKEMLEPKADITTNFHYGHFWYLLGPSQRPSLAAAFGNGGQRLSINPHENLITVIFAGKYNEPDAFKLPLKVIQQYLVPELRKAGKL